ncbi:MAG: hypothetical protein A2V74_11975 [Acidobacteria bacterium RBG_16_70_10]|nr:MAG: hypothetical protein A2V74_11975 [Acidobacteria bacterium RBG_16_70_10]
MVLPPSQLRFQKPVVLILLIWPRSFASEKTWFPSKEISLTVALGPSSTMKETCRPAPPITFSSCFTAAKGRPFWDSISRMIASTRRHFARS